VTPKDVYIAVVRLHLETDVLRLIPLVKYFFHGVILTTQSETRRTLVPLVAGVTEHLNLHLGIPLLLGPAPSFETTG
jgi:hypothetical protein